MRSLILSLLVLQFLLPGAYSEVEDRMKKPLMCKNPKGKLATSIMLGCSTATCRKMGKKALWQVCPQRALEKTAVENGRKLDQNHELLKEILENLGQANCCPTIKTTTWAPESTAIEDQSSLLCRKRYAHVHIRNSFDKEIVGVVKYAWCSSDSYKLAPGDVFTHSRGSCLITSISGYELYSPYTVCTSYSSSGTGYAVFEIIRKTSGGCYIDRPRGCDDTLEEKPPTPPPSPLKEFGPYGSLINANDNFTDKTLAIGQPNKILIHSGPYGNFPDVIVGIQVFYGDVAAELHGRKGSNLTTCVADPKNGIFFSQITGFARNKDDTSSLISQLGVKNQNGGSLCVPPVGGSSQVGKKFMAPDPLVQTLELSFIEGKTTSSNVLGQLTFFFQTIDEEKLHKL